MDIIPRRYQILINKEIFNNHQVLLVIANFIHVHIKVSDLDPIAPTTCVNYVFVGEICILNMVSDLS